MPDCCLSLLNNIRVALKRRIAGDETYYPDVAELKEYVLNELAVIPKWQKNDAWLLGQFSAICMQSTLYLLDICLKDRSLKVNEFGSAFAVVKAIAIAVSIVCFRSTKQCQKSISSIGLYVQFVLAGGQSSAMLDCCLL